jgi:two-component system nitrogen regulation sensor histidine kinase NtrY
MRLRFAISGHAPKAEVKEPVLETPVLETKVPQFETVEPAEATNSETKIEAATGN